MNGSTVSFDDVVVTPLEAESLVRPNDRAAVPAIVAHRGYSAITAVGSVDLPHLANEVVIHPQDKFAYLRFATGDIGRVGIENPAAMTPTSSSPR